MTEIRDKDLEQASGGAATFRAPCIEGNVTECSAFSSYTGERPDKDLCTLCSYWGITDDGHTPGCLNPAGAIYFKTHR